MENKVKVKSELELELVRAIKAKLCKQDILLEKICNSAGSSEASSSDIESNTSDHYSDYLRGVYFIKEWLISHRHELGSEALAELKALVARQTEKLTHYEQFLERSLNRVIC